MAIKKILNNQWFFFFVIVLLLGLRFAMPERTGEIAMNLVDEAGDQLPGQITDHADVVFLFSPQPDQKDCMACLDELKYFEYLKNAYPEVRVSLVIDNSQDLYPNIADLITRIRSEYNYGDAIYVDKSQSLARKYHLISRSRVLLFDGAGSLYTIMDPDGVGKDKDRLMNYFDYAKKR